jgi:hypothetical protein
MAKFVKGQPRPKGAGRKPGSRNKVTRTVKDTFAAVFNELQADPKTELAAWARKNRTNLRLFYQLSARFIPIEASVGVQVSATRESPWLEKPTAEWSHEDVREYARQQVYLLTLAQGRLQDLGISTAAQACELAGQAMWAAVSQYLKGEASAPVLALSAPAPTEKVINPKSDDDRWEEIT